VGPYGHSNTTGTSLFVIEALLATFVRSAADSCTGTLRLESVSPAATWFSGKLTSLKEFLWHQSGCKPT
jgi:hypothetical protein